MQHHHKRCLHWPVYTWRAQKTYNNLPTILMRRVKWIGPLSSDIINVIDIICLVSKSQNNCCRDVKKGTMRNLVPLFKCQLDQHDIVQCSWHRIIMCAILPAHSKPQGVHCIPVIQVQHISFQGPENLELHYCYFVKYLQLIYVYK